MSQFQPQTFGKYVLVERIGSGGMAEIFRALAYGVEGFTKEVCIKRILPNLTADETFIRMFVGEAKLAVNLHHPNIVQIYDLGRIGEHYFIAMELVRGRDLLAIINRARAQKRRLPLPVVLYIISEVCKGLDYAHNVAIDGQPAGIIHRDVSPSNILVSWEGEVKVADFGIAKAAFKNEKTVTGTLKGKYGYMSPEQVQGKTIDHRSDIFAAGILLWESLVARRLFKGETDLDTLEAVKTVRLPGPPSKFNREVPPGVDAVVARALTLDPAERFQSAAEMADALDEQLFALGYRMDAKRLGQFMKKIFSEEIAREQQRRRDESQPRLQVPLLEDGQSPPTRMDVPAPLPAPPSWRHSPLLVGAVGTLIIVLLGALVVLGFWIVNRPPPLVLREQPPSIKPEPLPSPAALLERAVLEVFSRPEGASLSINGRQDGHTTPCRLGNLEAGRFKLRLEKEGYQPWEREVELFPGQLLSIEAVLEKAPPPPRPRAPVLPVGKISISTVPVWAYVYVDGRRLEQPTPLFELELPAGEHQIRLVNPKLGKEKRQTVNIQPGKTLELVVPLE